MPPKDTKSGMKRFHIDLNLWNYNKLKAWATENGMGVRAAVRYIINQFFKTKP